MAKDKERSVNPAQAARKAEKAKALKKSKAELQTRRNEKLANRNPSRIQRQIDDLKALEEAGDIKVREKAILADLERDLKAVLKAREALGDKAPQYASPREQRQQSGVLGKRGRDGERKHNGWDRGRRNSGSDTDDSIRRIPWPRDTPPPVPHEFRRSRNEETAPLEEGRSYPLPPKPVQAQTVYSSAPQVRDLKKEAISRFIPAAVKRKQDVVKGASGRLMEPEELDRLEAEGYLNKESSSRPNPTSSISNHDDEVQRLKAEEEAFEKELAMAAEEEDDDHDKASDAPNQSKSTVLPLAQSRHVEIEEVEDEEA